MPFTDEYFRTWDGPFPFSEEAINGNAPDETGVYQVLRINEESHTRVYVGIVQAESGQRTIRQRLLEHFRGEGNRELSRHRGEHDLFFGCYRCDPESARQIESHMLAHGMPEFNRRNEYANYIPNITVH